MKETFGNSGGEGGLFFLKKKWKFRVGGGSYRKFPPWWRYGYFLEIHNLVKTTKGQIRNYSKFLVILILTQAI